MYIVNLFSQSQIRWIANDILDTVIYMVLVCIAFSPWDKKTFQVFALIGLAAFFLQKILLILDGQYKNKMEIALSTDLKTLRDIRFFVEKRSPVTDEMINLSKSNSLEADIAYKEYCSHPRPFASVGMKEL